MKNTFGASLTLTLFGESHGVGVGAVLDGITPGLDVDETAIAAALARRRPTGGTDTTRREPDKFQILSGVLAGKTTGTPLCIFIPNEDTKSGDYTYGPARPSHADFAAHCKYHGFEDYRGGGHFSGRVTAALVAAGSILRAALESLGIQIGTHILQCGKVRERTFIDPIADIKSLEAGDFPTLSADAAAEMQAEILAAKEALDSVGGVTETAVCGLPAGLGEPWFDSVEGVLSHALFSLGGIKGVEFGAGFAVVELRGSEANDAFCVRDGRVLTETNRSGGINGGLTNGMPVVFRCAVKPTPSIARPQKTVDFCRGEETVLEIKGRHDPAILRRICPVIDALTAVVLADLLVGRYGTDVLREGLPQ